MFTLNNEADISGTSLKGYIQTTYKKLSSKFGAPIDSDGYKISGEWTFTNDSGDVFTVYDWKLTNLYDPDELTVEDFRSLPNNVTFNIGGKTSAHNFIQWIEKQLNS